MPHKFNADKQQQFIDDYKVLKDSADQNEQILFVDMVHPSQSTKLSSGWMKEGKNQVKMVETTGSRTRLNILGALNLRCIEDTVICEYPSINAESIKYFFGSLRRLTHFRKKSTSFWMERVTTKPSW